MSAEVTRIEIKVGDQTLSMTPDEAKDLMQALESVLGQPKQQFAPYPMPYPAYPTYPNHWVVPYTWTITSGHTYSNTNTISVAASPDSSVYLSQ